MGNIEQLHPIFIYRRTKPNRVSASAALPVLDIVRRNILLDALQAPLFELRRTISFGQRRNASAVAHDGSACVQNRQRLHLENQDNLMATTC